MYHVGPLKSHKQRVAFKCRMLRNVVLGAESIIHVVQVHHKVPAPHMAPGDQKRGPESSEMSNKGRFGTESTPMYVNTITTTNYTYKVHVNF